MNSPFVGIHLDVGNIHDTGFAEQWIEMHGPRITRIHLKDVMKKRGRCGDATVYTSLYIGDNNWPAIRAAIKKVNYDGWLVIEAFGRALPALAAATRVWRDLFPSADEVVTQGLRFMKEKWAAAAR